MEDLSTILLDLVREGRVYQALMECRENKSIKFCESILGNVLVITETGDDTIIDDDELPDMIDAYDVFKVHVETNDSDPLHLPILDNVEYNIFPRVIE